MDRPIAAWKAVDVPFGRARARVLDGLGGLVADPAPFALELGDPSVVTAGLAVPLRAWGAGALEELRAELTVSEHHPGTRIDLRGQYRPHLDGTFGGGLVAHRLVRGFAEDLVDGIAARLREGR